MKTFLPLAIAGLFVVLLIFDPLRRGSLMLSFSLIASLAAVAYFVSGRLGHRTFWRSCGAFCSGVLIAEAYLFGSWYYHYHQQFDITTGLEIALLETMAICFIGSVTIFFMSLLRKVFH